MTFVDVILPLPLPGTFTYSLPAPFEQKVGPGMRVVVPLGRNKSYTGVVFKVHTTAPDFEVRPVTAVPDEFPVLLPSQVALWEWISTYYMAPLGDVYKAAVPAGLKAEEGYRPKTERYVALSSHLHTAPALHLALSMLRKAVKQQAAFACFLELSGWDKADAQTDPPTVREVTREELLNVSHVSLPVIQALVSKKLLVEYNKEVGRLNTDTTAPLTPLKPLSTAQQDAYNAVVFQFLKKDVVLLHGVTSSGKTEIYTHLIQKTIDEGKQVLYLLPEIALTVQITQRLKHMFGARLGIYHSRYSDAERVEIWNKQLSAMPYDIILGARSAVFLPFHRLGLVIVDEEHETSFKQQEPSPRYHARSVAILMASRLGAKTLLGTATPSVESYFNATRGKYGLVTLTTRYKDVQLPEVTVVDAKDLVRRKLMSGPFSPQLLAATRHALAAGKQAIFFQNRRGFAPMITCNTCGWTPKCVNCDVSLTLHKSLNKLTCHYCGYTFAVPEACPNCESTELKGRGFGTEKIEDHIAELLPEARVARMDLDTTRTRNAYERLIGDFSTGKTNVLVGTQMVTKGLDFDRVAVVGILNADGMLSYPDFRAYEHAFTMMTQVSGRAGRKGERGKVFLQTKNADLPVIQQVVGADYAAFFADTLEERRMFRYPPFCSLIAVYLKHKREDVAESAGIELGSRLRQMFGERVLGPDKPGVAMVKTLHIRKLLLKIEPGLNLMQVRRAMKQAEAALMTDKRYALLQVYYDVDPV